MADIIGQTIQRLLPHHTFSVDGAQMTGWGVTLTSPTVVIRFFKPINDGVARKIHQALDRNVRSDMSRRTELHWPMGGELNGQRVYGPGAERCHFFPRRV